MCYSNTINTPEKQEQQKRKSVQAFLPLHIQMNGFKPEYEHPGSGQNRYDI